jgi:hypothetical protein
MEEWMSKFINLFNVILEGYSPNGKETHGEFCLKQLRPKKQKLLFHNANKL